MRFEELFAFLKRRWHFAAAALFVVLQSVLMWLFMAASSPTYDEPALLCASLNSAKNSDYRISPELGPAVLTWLALPNLGVEFPPSSEVSMNVPVFYNQVVDPLLDKQGKASIYARARCMTALLNVFCGLLIFFAALRVAGKAPAVLTHGLYCLLPVLLSNGALATSDMFVTFASALCCLAFCLVFRKLSLASLLFLAFAGALLALGKMSGLLIIPAGILALALKCFISSPLRLALPGIERRVLRKPWEKLAALAAAFALAALLVWAAIWAAYGFRYRPCPENVKYDLVDPSYVANGGLASKTLAKFMELRLFPEAWLYGVSSAISLSSHRLAFLNGELSTSGFRSFFPQVFVMKNPPGAIAAFAAGAAAFLLYLRSRSGRRRLMPLAPFLLFGGLYLASALHSEINIGIRHLMPAYPALLLLAAFGFRSLLRQKSRAARAIPVLLVLATGVECFAASPRQLAYFSPLYGGPSQAYKHVMDSSLDWGQDLKNFKSGLEELGVPVDGSVKIFFCYFGSIPPKRGCGVPVTILPLATSESYDPERVDLEPGIYCVSASALDGMNYMYTLNDVLKSYPLQLEKLSRRFYAMKSYQDRNDVEGFKRLLAGADKFFAADCMQYELIRFELLRQGLLKKEPIGNIGYTILVYKVDREELDKFLAPLLAVKNR